MNLKKSLKNIRKDLIKKHNIFKTIKHVYPHLEELSNSEILNYYDLNSIKLLEVHVETIQKILLNRENNYQKELQELNACFCLDGHGDFKYIYQTKKEALRQIEYSWKTKRVKLTVYTCPYHCGWHLSKI